MLQDNRTSSTQSKAQISWTTIILTATITIAQSIPMIILQITIIKAYSYFLLNPLRIWIIHLFQDNHWIYLNYLLTITTIYHNLKWISQADTHLSSNNNRSNLTTNLSNSNVSHHKEDHNSILARIVWVQAVYILTTTINLKLIYLQDLARMN